MKEPLLKTSMTPFPYSVDIKASIDEAMQQMEDHRIKHLPVTQNNELAGIITDRDINLLLGPEPHNPGPNELTVEDAITEGCYSVDINTRLIPVLRHMSENHISSAVITFNGRIAGIFTTVDAYRAFADHLEAQFHLGETDPPDAA